MSNEQDDPEYLKNYELEDGDKKGVRSEEFELSGFDEAVDSDELLAEHGQDPIPALDHILLSIIAANPIIGETPKEKIIRLRKARAALLGENLKSGPIEADRNTLLLEMGWRYILEIVENNQCAGVKGKTPTITPIAREVVEEFGKSYCSERSVDEDSLVAMLRRDFTENKNLWIVRASRDKDWDWRMSLANFRKILRELQDYGVPLDPLASQPATLSEPKKTKKDETPVK